MASAVLFALCFPGGPFPWLAWVALVPLFCALRHATPLRALFFGGIFGWLIWFSSVWWLKAPLHDIMGMRLWTAAMLVAGGCLFLALPYAIFTVTAAAWRRKPGIAGAIRDAALFTVLTILLGVIFHGNIAHSQHVFPAVLQVLELGGTPLLLFAVYWVNRLVAEFILMRQERHAGAWKPAAAAGIALALLLGYGAVRLWQFDSAMKSAPATAWFNVGVVQPNIPIVAPVERQPAPDAIDNDFFTAMTQAKTLAARHPEIELIVLPENPDFFLFHSDQKRRAALAEMQAVTSRPTLINVNWFDAAQAEDGRTGRYNATVLLDAAGNVSGTYLKIKRVPVVEYLPGESRLPWLRNWFPNSLRLLEGPGPGIFEIRDGVRVIPSVCYESTFPGFARAFARQGGNIIVNQTNDSWFLRTPASEVHLALALFRTVELRVPLVRATNGGITAFIQADGRIIPGSQTELFVESELAFPVYIPPKRSFYAAQGNWFLLVCLLAVPLAGISATEKRRAEKRWKHWKK